MKYIVGVVPSRFLDGIRQALGSSGIYRLTIGEVEIFEFGAGKSPGAEERCLRLEIAVNDDFLQPALDSFERVATESGGTLRVSVLQLEQAQRIRTGESGDSAP